MICIAVSDSIFWSLVGTARDSGNKKRKKKKKKEKRRKKKTEWRKKSKKELMVIIDCSKYEKGKNRKK